MRHKTRIDRSLGRHPKPFPVAAVQRNRRRSTKLIGCERNCLAELRLIWWIVHEHPDQANQLGRG
jgi:hypothetical protein